jgi:hypothetical protein
MARARVGARGSEVLAERRLLSNLGHRHLDDGEPPDPK